MKHLPAAAIKDLVTIPIVSPSARRRSNRRRAKKTTSSIVRKPCKEMSSSLVIPSLTIILLGALCGLGHSKINCTNGVAQFQTERLNKNLSSLVIIKRPEASQANSSGAKQETIYNQPFENLNKQQASKLGDLSSIGSFLNFKHEHNLDKLLSFGFDELVRMVYYPDSSSNGSHGRNKGSYSKDLSEPASRKRRVERSVSAFEEEPETEILGMTNDSQPQSGSMEPRARRVHRELGDRNDTLRLIRSFNPSLNVTHMKMVAAPTENSANWTTNRNHLFANLNPPEVGSTNLTSNRIGANRRRARKNYRLTSTSQPQLSDIPGPISSDADEGGYFRKPEAGGEQSATNAGRYLQDVESLDELGNGEAVGNFSSESPTSNDSEQPEANQDEEELNSALDHAVVSTRPLSGRAGSRPRKSAKLVAADFNSNLSTQIPPPEQSPLKVGPPEQQQQHQSSTIGEPPGDYANQSSGLISSQDLPVPQVGDPQVLADQTTVYNSNNGRLQPASGLTEAQLGEILRQFGISAENTRPAPARGSRHAASQQEVNGINRKRNRPGEYGTQNGASQRARIRSSAPYTANLNPSGSTINSNWNNVNQESRIPGQSLDLGQQLVGNSRQRLLLAPQQEINPNNLLESSFYANAVGQPTPFKQHSKRGDSRFQLPVAGQQFTPTPANLIPPRVRSSNQQQQYYYQRPVTRTGTSSNLLDEHFLAPQSQILGLIRAAQAPSFNQPVTSSRQKLVESQAVVGPDQLKVASVSSPAVVFTQQPGNLFPNLQSSPSFLATPPIRFATSKGALRAAAQHRSGRIGSSTGSGAPNQNQQQQQYNDEQSAQGSAAATSDPMWSDTQNQEDEYQQAPQTIQITAVPNGGFVGNGLVGNGLVGNGWNGWNGWNGVGGGPWNGRQVLLVNRQPQVGSEWRQWVLPVAAVLALPLILGALFVPVFLKSVMFLIQILQMLGLLMPPAQLAGHLASSAHSASSSVG